jgi:molecular chaperone DnaJ|tara:strand:- start:618 stop:1553 length:936 start_codon:yes stop_codon:yes gene_type:complete
MNNYYDILGVREDSTPEEIKRAYRKLSKEHHPDMGGDGEKFKNISEAYGTLGEKNKKNEYDNRRNNPFSGGNMGQDDIFDQFFHGQQRGGNVQQAENLNANVDVTLEEINNGTTKTIRFNRVILDKSQQMKVCRHCNGAGTITLMGPFRTKCTTCSGSGREYHYKKISQEITFDVPKGVKNGETIFYAGLGNETLRGPGNLFIKLNEKAHPIFTREGDNLIISKKIPFPTLILGGSIEVKTLTGKIKVKVGEYSKPNHRLRVAGKGLTNEEGYNVGDLIVELVPITPKKITKEERKLLEELNNSKSFSIIK